MLRIEYDAYLSIIYNGAVKNTKSTFLIKVIKVVEGLV